MAKKNFYAVRKGKVPGVYQTWKDCQDNILGFSGAEYKGFTTKDEAEAYMEGEDNPVVKSNQVKKEVPDVLKDVTGPYSFVDGSYNQSTGMFGFGGFLCVGDKKYPLQGKSDKKELASMWNVAGEISGAIAAVKKAEALKLPSLTILYDYAGIEEWALGRWKAKKEGTKEYARIMKIAMLNMDITFKKVAGHTGIDGNETADAMAKEAVGIQLTKKQKTMLDELRKNA